MWKTGIWREPVVQVSEDLPQGGGFINPPHIIDVHSFPYNDSLDVVSYLYKNISKKTTKSINLCKQTQDTINTQVILSSQYINTYPISITNFKAYEMVVGVEVRCCRDLLFIQDINILLEDINYNDLLLLDDDLFLLMVANRLLGE